MSAAEASKASAPSRNALYLPLALTAALGLLSFLPRVQSNPRLVASFWGAILALLVFNAVLALRLKRAGEAAALTTVLRPQHYIQAGIQLALFAYWGWFWRPVYDFAPLLVAQLVFAYAFGMLLTWSRGKTYSLGFGPFPIIFSTNLFLWFHDDWFYLQFLMVAVGFLGKEFVQWYRDGRKVHIFNPSAFSLGLFSLILIATGTTDLTWGQQIASTLTLAPGIYSYLFLLGLIVMYFFSITLVAGMAAATLFAGSALYMASTGVPYFVDSEIPAAVFLGLHLLITDPSTSPRTPPGKLLFGFGYGVGVFALYAILGWAGAPTFYDKLLCVPVLNLSVRGIDGFIKRAQAREWWTRLKVARPFELPNKAHMAVWAVFFLAMTAMGKTDGRHPGDTVPFWEQACQEGRHHACAHLLQIEASYCDDNSAWACNEVGVYTREGRITEANPDLALEYFDRACELRFQAACFNVLDAGTEMRAPPKVLDLRLILREGGGNLMGESEPELYERACDHGFAFACGRMALSL